MRTDAATGGALRSALGWAAGGRLVTIAGLLVANAVLARVLPKDALGAFFLAYSTVAIAAAGARLGMSRVAVRLLAAHRARDDWVSIRSTSRALRQLSWMGAVAGALVVSAVVGAGGSLAGSELRGVALLLAVWTAAEALRFVSSESLRALDDARRATLYGDALRAVLLTAAAVLAYAVGTHDLHVVLLLAVASSVITAGVAERRFAASLDGAPAVATAPLGPVVALGLPLMVADLAAVLVDQGDIWVVGALRPASDVAVYGAAGRLAILMAVPLFVVNAALAPTLAKLYARGRVDDLERTARGAATLTTGLVLSGVLLAVVFGQQIVEAVFGAGFGDSADVLLILAAGQAVNAWSGPCAVTLMMTGYERIVMSTVVVASVGAVLAEVLLGHVVGLVGVAVASAAGTALSNVALLLLARQRLGIWTSATAAVGPVRALLVRPVP